MRLIAIVTAFAVLILGSPAVAAAGSMTIANSASFVVDPIPRGSILTIQTDRVVSLTNTPTPFNPWVTQAPGGLTVTATCSYYPVTSRALPILYVGPSYGGSQINVYYPNDMGIEPFFRCANTGPTHIVVYPAGGGVPIEMDASTVNSHPGIFGVGITPSGNHMDITTGTPTSLLDCAARLPADTKACRPRTDGEYNYLVLLLTGAEAFVGSPNYLIFEIAPVVNGVQGGWRPLQLGSLVPDSTGVEKATVYLRYDTTAGEHRIRVRFDGQPVIPPPLTIELGEPS